MTGHAISTKENKRNRQLVLQEVRTGRNLHSRGRKTAFVSFARSTFTLARCQLVSVYNSHSVGEPDLATGKWA